MWKFAPAPAGWWVSVSARFRKDDPVAEAIMRDYIEYLERFVLELEDRRQWFDKTFPLRTELGSEYTRFRYFGSVRSIISKIYPELVPKNSKYLSTKVIRTFILITNNEISSILTDPIGGFFEFRTLFSSFI